ncbi:MAG TPA: phasin family protein [Acidiphilium sp.]|nr:phasin family protein [Acidiphilium sp.]HQU23680.1 phasin family protein [Acidiphilium sp.]
MMAVSKTSKTNKPKLVSQKAEGPKAQSSKAPGPKAEPQKLELPKVEAPKVEPRAEPKVGAKTAAPMMAPLGAFMPDIDFSKAFGAMKMPAIPDMDVVLAAYRRNMEALSEANRVALEGAQAVARRHMEIMQQTMTELTDQLRGLSATETPKARATKQAELLKHAYETAVTNMRDLGDLIQRSNHEAVSKLNHRFSEAMDEMKGLIDKGTKKK